MDCKTFLDFASLYGDDVTNDAMGRITEAECNPSRAADFRVKMHDIHRHNACNHTLSGEVDINGKWFGFVIDSGDRNGTVVREWGDADDICVYEAPLPPRYGLVPANPNLRMDRPGLYGVYLKWREESWFKDLVRGYAYDSHFAPGIKTETHYRKKAEARGLRFECVEPDWKPEPAVRP